MSGQRRIDSGQSGNDGVFGKAAAGSDGGAASAGEIISIGTEDAFDDAEVAQTAARRTG